MALNGSLLKFLKAGPAIASRSGPGSLRVLVTGGPGMPEGMNPQMQESAGADDIMANSMGSESRGMASSAAAREVIDETMDEAEKMKDKAKDARQKADSMAGQIKDKAQDIGEHAKQTVQDVWGSAKDTAQKVKETVVGKAEDAKEFISEKAEAAENAIKTGIAQGQTDAEAGRNTIKASAFKQAANNKDT